MAKKEKYLEYFVPKRAKQIALSHLDDYRLCPVSFIEFCLSDEYLGLQDDVYDTILEIGQEIVEGGYREVAVEGGIGSGKSFLSQLLSVYYAYHVLALKDPHKYFGLSRDKPIEIMNMGLNSKQAKDVVFSGIRQMVRTSKCFLNMTEKYLSGFDEKKQEIIFREMRYDKLRKPFRFEILRMTSGNSQETAPIGRNLFAGILDEANFYQSNDEKDNAESIYNSMKARIASRFGMKGHIIAISSPKYKGDFMSRKREEAMLNPDVVYHSSKPTWIYKDRDRMSKEVFVFDNEDMAVVGKELYGNYCGYNLEYSPSQAEGLKYGDGRDARFWIIPMDYYDNFKINPEVATRDLGCRPVGALQGFITNHSAIDEAMNKGCPNMFDRGVFDVSKIPLGNEFIYIHIDIGMNRNGKGDCAGIAGCRCVGFDENNFNRPIVEYIFVEQIRAPEGGEIKISDLRSYIFTLVQAGWLIGKVTLDTFQSFDTVQILNSRGILTGNLSVDTSLAPYEALKEGIYQGTVSLPKHEVLRTELKELELVKGMKVDHPINGSKDVSDAVAGSYFSCISDISDAYAQKTVKKISIKR